MVYVVLVTGGRDYADAAGVKAALDAILAKHPDIEIMHGAARGADTLGDRWAEWNGCPRHPHPAQWLNEKSPGGVDSAAGVRRNQEMVNLKPDVVIGFPGKSGTIDCLSRAKKAGLNILVWMGRNQFWWNAVYEAGLVETNDMKSGIRIAATRGTT